MNIKNFLFPFLTILFLSAAFLSCGDNSVSNNNTPITKPNILLKQGSTFTYTYDSVTSTQTFRMRRSGLDSIAAQTTIGGKLCSQVNSSMYDSVTHQKTPTIYYIYYDSSAGKFYQYGVIQLINPTQSPTWDLVADFSIPLGQAWTIGNVYDTIILASQHVVFSGPLTAKVAEQTTIQTTGPAPATINCFRIELNANVSGNTVGGTATASIFFDYYLGYASTSTNPSGIVELKLRPFVINISGQPIFPESGFDKKLYSYTIAP